MPLPTFGLGALGKFLGGAAAHEATREVIKNGLDRVVKIVVQRGEDLTRNYREDYTEVMRHLEIADPAAADRIKQAQQQALDANVENLFILALGSYIPRDKDTAKVKMDEAVERFAWLGGKEEHEFNLIVEGLKHDPVAQFIRHWILGNLAAAWNFIDAAAGRLARGLQPTAAEYRARNQKKGWRSWLR